jgi:hypothetical protein
MRKYLKLSVIAVCFMVVGSCSTRRTSNPSAVAQQDGTITVVATGEAWLGSERWAWLGDKGKKNAEISAFRQLFFRGFPASQQTTPLIGYNEEAILNQHSTYFEQLFGKGSKGRYWSFVTQSEVVKENANGLFFKDRVTVNITINLRALRTDLEQNGVIRRFGL